MHDVVEDDQPASGVVAEEADVGGQWVGHPKIPDRAIAVDLNTRGRNRVDLAVDHAAVIGNATARRPRRGGGQQRQCANEKQDCDPLGAPHHMNCAARSHVRPRSHYQAIRRR